MWVVPGIHIFTDQISNQLKSIYNNMWNIFEGRVPLDTLNIYAKVRVKPTFLNEFIILKLQMRSLY